MANSEMTSKLRVVDTESLSAAENMALDETLLELKEENLIPDTIRFLSFNPHCVLAGRFQAVENEARLGYCSKNGIEVNRRITGGGALYWATGDIGWEIFSTYGRFSGMASKVEDYYRLFCHAVAEGLKKFNLNAKFRPRNDIEINGRKISGSGGTSIKNAFMFQGTLLVDTDIDLLIRALRVPVEKLKYREINSLKDRITWLSRELGYLPARKQIIENILAGFSVNLGLDFYFDDLGKPEKELFKKKIEYFRSRKHIFKIKKSANPVSAASAIVKTRTGYLKCGMSVDFKRNVLRSSVFTGDFFIYPGRAIFDLESVLKNIPLDYLKISHDVEQFYSCYQQKIEGITKEVLLESLKRCLQKIGLARHGLPYSYIKDVFFTAVNGKKSKNANDFKNCRDYLSEIKVFLLPYCAKHPECKFRNTQGCNFCGKCSTGEAVKLLDAAGIESITITSYEHLERTLKRLKKDGKDFFGGACCETFFIRHIQDFERIGLAGVLINVDNTTCYDLGKYEQAYSGKFEGFTGLKLPVIKKIIRL